VGNLWVPPRLLTAAEGRQQLRPNVQVFRDAHEREGINATVQLERPDAPEWIRQVWLVQVVRFEHLDSSMASEN